MDRHSLKNHKSEKVAILPTFIQIVLELIAWTVRKEKKSDERLNIEKEETKLALFATDVDCI